MPRRTIKFEDDMRKRLRNPEFAAAFLETVLNNDGKDRNAVFLRALGDVARAYGMTKLAKKTDMAREAMYRSLSKRGNPELETLTAVLDAVGLQISIKVKKRAS